jgi:antitoxin component of MazEF toxin-antitoxin module
MIKTISKVGNSQGVIFDSALMELARLKVGDAVDVVVHDSGAITLTPLRPVITPERAKDVAEEVIRDYNEVFRRLS